MLHAKTKKINHNQFWREFIEGGYNVFVLCQKVTIMHLEVTNLNKHFASHNKEWCLNNILHCGVILGYWERTFWCYHLFLMWKTTCTSSASCISSSGTMFLLVFWGDPDKKRAGENCILMFILRKLNVWISFLNHDYTLYNFINLGKLKGTHISAWRCDRQPADKGSEFPSLGDPRTQKKRMS